MRQWWVSGRWLAGCAMALGLCCTGPVSAQRAAPAPAGDAGPQAALLEILAKDGTRQQVASTRTEVAVRIVGLVAQATLRQVFRNPTPEWIEARYLLPLPDTSAVYGMRIELPDRTIEGEIKEREQARTDYEAAKQEGMAAGLVEQQRAHLFDTRVANIPPGAEFTVEIAWWQTVDYADGVFEWRLPLTVRPRYAVAGSTDVGAVLDGMDPPQAQGETQQAAIHITLVPGLAIAPPQSPSHAIAAVAGAGHDEQRFTLRDAAVPLDRDFILRWQALPGAQPQAALFHESHGGEEYALLMVVPPVPAKADVVQRLPRELVLVLDSSGSMAGDAWDGARAAAHVALDQLGSSDRFVLIDFDSQPNPFRLNSEPATAEMRALAHQWIDTLSADGGTEIEAALVTALAVQPTQGLLRQVVFVTDGAVGNEAQIYHALVAARGAARIFTVGLSAAPNRAFLRKLAELGAGSSTLIGSLDEVEPGMRALFARLQAPLLTGLRVDWPALGEPYPEALPDLYQGEPLLLVSKLAHLKQAVRLEGMLAGGRWSQTLAAPKTAVGGIARLWARRKIASIEDRIDLGGDEAQLKPQVLEVALKHRLLSRYTSFVAIEKQKRRPDGSPMVPTEMVNRPPVDMVPFAQGALGWQGRLLLGLLILLGGLLLVAWRPAARDALAGGQ